MDWNVSQSAFWHLWFWVALLTESVDWNVLIRPIGMTTIRRSPHGERGLKYCMIFNRSILWSWSLSSRRAWIEIKYDGEFIQSSICRSPHGERGLKCCSRGVKRPKVESLSSRRAWIEMDLIQSGLTYPLQVALLTESVDWNNKSSYLFIKHCMSLSSRRAWIEMCLLRTTFFRRSVALLTESVDWNPNVTIALVIFDCRSPHGERGLK